jgi:DNA-binding MarR family transcriptional regulator
MDTTELSASLRSVISALHKGLRRQMGSATQYSMTELETVGHLNRNSSLLPSELAALTRIKTQSMSQILKKMEEQKIIVRTPSSDDKRKVFISLTPYGKKLVEKTRYDRDEWLKETIEKSLTKSEKDLIATALPALKKLAEFK